MDEDNEKVKSVILDTNIILSSLVKEEGFTQAVLAILLSQKDIKLYIPSIAKEEIKLHLPEISRKSNLPNRVITDVLNMIFDNIETVKEESFKNEIQKAFSLVTDENDSPFAGLAIKKAPSFLLTYNKKHFKVQELENMNVLVFTPSEFVKHFNLEIMLKKRVKRRRGILKLLSRLYILKRKP